MTVTHRNAASNSLSRKYPATKPSGPLPPPRSCPRRRRLAAGVSSGSLIALRAAPAGPPSPPPLTTTSRSPAARRRQLARTVCVRARAARPPVWRGFQPASARCPRTLAAARPGAAARRGRRARVSPRHGRCLRLRSAGSCPPLPFHRPGLAVPPRVGLAAPHPARSPPRGLGGNPARLSPFAPSTIVEITHAGGHCPRGCWPLSGTAVQCPGEAVAQSCG